MQHLSLSPANKGYVTWWSLGATSNAEGIVQAFDALGLSRFAPRPRSDHAALKAACEEYLSASFPSRDVLVLPLRGRDGFEAVVVKHGEDRNQHEHRFSVRLDNPPNGAGKVIRLVSGYASAWDIRERFDRIQGELPAAAVGKSLADAANALNGITLRTNGGFYWLPDMALDRWLQLCTAVEAAGKNNVWRMTIDIDANCTAAVTDALVREVTADVERIKSDLYNMTDDAAIERRRLAATELHDRVKAYETLLSTSLGELHTAIQTAEQVATLAAMASLGFTTPTS